MKKVIDTILPLFLLLVTVCMVTFSYTAYNQRMSITGGATIAKSDLDTNIYVSGIAFTNLTNASETYNPGYNDRQANIRLTLNDSTSTATYEVNITNNTNTPYKISEHVIKKSSDSIEFDKNSLYVGRIIPANSTITITYTITNTSNDQVSDNISINYEFVKNFNTVPKVKYDSTLGVEILSIGDEKFVVISKDSNNIKALSLYSLYVGINRGPTGAITKNISEYELGYGIQNENAKAYLGARTDKYGIAQFNSNNTLGASMSNAYNSQTLAYKHVQDYVGYLRDYYGINVSGSIPTIQDMNELGCSIVSKTNKNCAGLPSAIEGTFWTQTVYDSNGLFVVFHDKSVGFVQPTSIDYPGIRPIITIPTNQVVMSQAYEYQGIYTENNSEYPVTIINIGGEKFYKLRESGDNVIALAMHNLNTTTNKQYNDNTNNKVHFASSAYYGSMVGSQFVLDSNYGNSLPSYVYDNNSLIDLSQYTNKINSIAPNATVRLMNLDDYNSLCPSNTCDASKPYLTSTDYWTGIATNNTDVISITSGNGVATNFATGESNIRPVIELNKNYIDR